MNLTDTQQTIINNINQSLLVTAPAGAGKTEVMARRAANAKAQGKQNILCLTFTNRAASSMKKRIQRLTKNCAGITVCTFHAFCNMLIRAESDAIGLPYDYSVIDETDASAIIKKILPPGTYPLTDHDIRSAASSIDHYRLSLVMHRDISASLQEHFLNKFSITLEKAVTLYEDALHNFSSLDFLSLILTTYTFLSEAEHIQRWQKFYDFIQVDEMQDTGLIEYEIIAALAGQHKNLSLFGDTDQTIYEWRDSRPFEIIDNFKKTFNPNEYLLAQNFRSTGEITSCAEKFLSTYFNTQEKKIHAVNRDGDKPILCFLNNPIFEKKQINQIVTKMHSTGVNYKDIAVLTRTNNDASNYSRALADAGIPCYVMDEFNFFRREEIKDILSIFKLILNGNDTASAIRILTKFAKNIGEKTITDILASDAPIALSDFVLYAYQENQDLLQPVLDAYENNQIIVFDVESTGLNTETDEIVEIAAVRFGIDGILDEFHSYIQNTISVGISETVHGYSDKFLKENGAPAYEVLKGFLQFSEGCILCGHNVMYDITIVKSMLNRLNISFNFPYVYFDTLSAAKRMIKDAKNYKLGTLCSHLGIEEDPTHHAMDDVWATCELLEICIAFLQETQAIRCEQYDLYHEKFKDFSNLYKQLNEEANLIRPNELLQIIENKLNILSKYSRFPMKIENINELQNIVQELDDEILSPKASLRQITEMLTLSNSLERQISDADKCAVLTVHQSKGLQFDTVIIANAVEGAYPSKMNIKYEKFDEEARLFYVALTRASQHLFITLSAEDEHGRKNASSRFLKSLPKAHYEMRIQEQSK